MALDTHYGRSRTDAEGAQEGLLRSQFPPQDVTSYPSHKEIGHYSVWPSVPALSPKPKPYMPPHSHASPSPRPSSVPALSQPQDGSSLPQATVSVRKAHGRQQSNAHSCSSDRETGRSLKLVSAHKGYCWPYHPQADLSMLFPLPGMLCPTSSIQSETQPLGRDS